MSTNNSILVSEQLYREVSERAEQTGVSPQDWVSSVLEIRIRIERDTDEFFIRRAVGASTRPLAELLAKAPARSPDPGDELPEDDTSISGR